MPLDIAVVTADFTEYLPMIKYLPAAENRHFRIKCNWPDTLAEWLQYPDQDTRMPRTRLYPHQIKMIEIVYDRLRIISDPVTRAIVLGKSIANPHTANEYLSHKLRISTRTVQRRYKEGLAFVAARAVA